jgi:hypothetical protein
MTVLISIVFREGRFTKCGNEWAALSDLRKHGPDKKKRSPFEQDDLYQAPRRELMTTVQLELGNGRAPIEDPIRALKLRSKK